MYVLHLICDILGLEATDPAPGGYLAPSPDLKGHLQRYRAAASAVAQTSKANAAVRLRWRTVMHQEFQVWIHGKYRGKQVMIWF